MSGTYMYLIDRIIMMHNLLALKRDYPLSDRYVSIIVEYKHKKLRS